MRSSSPDTPMTETPYYPIFLKAAGRKALVIGGGLVAERKVRSLLACGVRVRVVSPSLTAGLTGLVRQGRLAHTNRRFRSSDLRDLQLVICATDDAALNHKAYEASKDRGILCNVVDAPELCDFVVPSVIRRGDLTVAVSTGGASPALSKKVRRELEAVVGPEYRAFLALMREVRPLIRSGVPEKGRRMRIHRDLVESRARSLLRRGRRREAREVVRKILAAHAIPWPAKRGT